MYQVYCENKNTLQPAARSKFSRFGRNTHLCSIEYFEVDEQCLSRTLYMNTGMNGARSVSTLLLL